MHPDYLILPRSLVRLLLALCLALPNDVLVAFCARAQVEDWALEELAALADSTGKGGLALRLKRLVTPLGEIAPPAVEFEPVGIMPTSPARVRLLNLLSPDGSETEEAPVG